MSIYLPSSFHGNAKRPPGISLGQIGRFIPFPRSVKPHREFYNLSSPYDACHKLASHILLTALLVSGTSSRYLSSEEMEAIVSPMQSWSLVPTFKSVWHVDFFRSRSELIGSVGYALIERFGNTGCGMVGGWWPWIKLIWS